MKQVMPNLRSKRSIYIAILVVVIAAAVAGALYYHHYEYQAVSFRFSNGTSATISRHNFNQMTPKEKQAFLHPVNEAVLHPCTGNPTDECIATPSADFWPIGSEGATNPYLKQSSVNPSEIMGRIVNDSTDTLQLRTTSGQLVSVVYPINPVTNFNSNYSSGYGFTIDIGDEIYVSYSNPMAKNNTIKTDQIINSTLIIKSNPKTGPIVKY